MKKAVRKNYRFDYATDHNLRQLVGMTGKPETQVVEEAIAAYLKSLLYVEGEMERVLAETSL